MDQPSKPPILTGPPEAHRTNDDGYEPDAQMREEGPAIGPFIAVIGECLALVDLLKERVDDHLGLSPDDVRWGHVADAQRLLGHLRNAAFVAELGDEPPL